jgi:hypothetical protein
MSRRNIMTNVYQQNARWLFARFWITLLLLSTLLGLGCKAGPGSKEEGLDLDLPHGPPTHTVLLGDAPAMRAYELLDRKFKTAVTKDLQFSIYELEPVGDASTMARARADALGVVGPVENEQPTIEDPLVTITEGDTTLSIDSVSGTERLIMNDLFHASPGVPRKKLRADPEYVDSAQLHLRKVLPPRSAQLLDPNIRDDSARLRQTVYPYKLRRFLNAVTVINDPASGQPSMRQDTEEAYQVAVAFNIMLGGLPVIGPGSKASVHLTPTGQPIFHEISIRPVKSRRATVRAEDIFAPGEAQAILETDLRARGNDPSLYILRRKEFGYFRNTHRSVQNIVAPYYGYVYDPGPTIPEAKRIVEVVLAIKNPRLLEIINPDLRDETARKEILMRRAAPPDTSKGIIIE